MWVSVALWMVGAAWGQAVPAPAPAPAPAPVPAPSSAPSPADEERAKLLFNNGRALYAEGNYEAAIVAFREAYALSGRHELLFNVANAEERLGQLQEALDTLNLYRAYAAPDQQEAILRRIRNIERRIEQEGAPPATATSPVVAPATPTPTPALTSVPPVPVPSPVPVPAPATAGRPRPGLWTLGAGLALAAGGGVAALVTYDASRPLLREGGPENRARYETLRPVNHVALAGAAAGGTLALTGLVIDLAGSARTVALAPARLPGGTGGAPGLVVAMGGNR